MNRIARVIPALLATALAGCANPLKMLTAETPEELLSSDSRSAPYCAPGDLEEVKRRVRAHLERCNRPFTQNTSVSVAGSGTFYPTIEQRWEVKHRPSPGGGEEYFVKTGLGYLLATRVEPTKECQATVTTYIKTGTTKRFDLVNAAARGETAACLPP